MVTKVKPKAKATASKKAPVKKAAITTGELLRDEQSGDRFDELQQAAAEYLGLVNITNRDNCGNMKERHDVLLERLKAAAKASFSKH